MPPPPSIHLKLLLFTRYPTLGLAKSRLIPALGATGAARLQRRMTEEVLGVARRFQAATQTSDEIATTIRICFTGAHAADFRAWLGDDLEYQRQAAGKLGQRLRQAIDLAFRPRLANQSCDGLECGIPLQDRRLGNEIEMTLVIGSDIPRLSAELLDQAVAGLRNHDLVLGPAADGGYYLIGMKEPQPGLFHDIAWGTDRVGAQTLAAADRLGLSHTQLPVREDIDRPADLAQLANDPRFADFFGQPRRLSVIIPTLNEAAALPQTLVHLQKAVGTRNPTGPAPTGETSSPPALEIIVADGGSSDHTRAIARHHGAQVIEVAGGRAAQLNAGAAAARGEWLLFLHADTQPPAGYPELIRRALDDPATVAGAFSLGLDAAGPAPRLMAWGANQRSRYGHLPYGDQGLFIGKRIFSEVGGFPAMPIMEDFQLVRRLKRRGRVITLPQPVITAARRWQQLGVWRTFAVNQLMILGFLLGVAPARLARFYRFGTDTNGKKEPRR